MRTRRFNFLFFVLILGLCLLIGAAVIAQEATPVVTAASETSPFDIPPEIAGHEQEWPLGNHDYSNTRVAVNSTINASNVSTLGVAWTSKVSGGGGWGAATGNPVISNGVVYYEDLSSNIYAVDFKTGSKVWEADFNNHIFGPTGVGLGYGKVYAFNRIDRGAALDISTAKNCGLSAPVQLCQEVGGSLRSLITSPIWPPRQQPGDRDQ